MNDKKQVIEDYRKPQQSLGCEPFYIFHSAQDQPVVKFLQNDHAFSAPHDKILIYASFRKEAFRQCGFVLPERLTKASFYKGFSSWEDVVAASRPKWLHFLKCIDDFLPANQMHWFIETWREQSPHRDCYEWRFRVEIPLSELAEYVRTNWQVRMDFALLHDEIHEYIEQDMWEQDVLSVSEKNWPKLVECDG